MTTRRAVDAGVLENGGRRKPAALSQRERMPHIVAWALAEREAYAAASGHKLTYEALQDRLSLELASTAHSFMSRA